MPSRRLGAERESRRGGKRQILVNLFLYVQSFRLLFFAFTLFHVERHR